MAGSAIDPPVFALDMDLEASSGSLALAPSFSLSASGTFVKEDFVINKNGIAAINHTEVRRTGLQLSDLELHEVLGKGASSLVRRAVHTPTGTQLAVKILNVFDKGKRDQLLRELRTLYTSQNFPWLVAFHDCLYDEGAMCGYPCPRRPLGPCSSAAPTCCLCGDMATQATLQFRGRTRATFAGT